MEADIDVVERFFIRFEYCLLEARAKLCIIYSLFTCFLSCDSCYQLSSAIAHEPSATGRSPANNRFGFTHPRTVLGTKNGEIQMHCRPAFS